MLALASAGCSGGAPDGEVQGDGLGRARQALGIAPGNTLPPAQTTPEDSLLRFSSGNGNALVVADPDSQDLTVQVDVTNGVFWPRPTPPELPKGLVITGAGTIKVIFSGSWTAINDALDGARFVPTADYAGLATLQIRSSDSDGNSDLDTLDITVTALNDPPANNVPAGLQAATEDVPRAFNIPVTDIDVAGSPLRVILKSSNGTVVTLPRTTGLTFTVGNGDADADMTFEGTLDNVNAALNGLTITPPLNYIGQSTLEITSDDLGATGNGVVTSDFDSMTIQWAPVNDAPVNAVPGPQTLAEEGSFTFAGATALSVNDVDATSALVQVTLNSVGGTLTLGGTTDLSFAAGDGDSDSTMTFTGTLAALNAALANTRFDSTPNFAGAATVTLITNDLGNTGVGGARQDSDTVALTVTAVNDAPVNSVPATQSTNEGVARAFSLTNGNAITVADVDAPTLQVTLSATQGALTLGSKTGLTFQAGDGADDSIVTFTGTIAALNTALNNLTFIPGANFYGQASLTVLTKDLGATGSGGALQDQDVIFIDVSSVNDAPDAVSDVLTVAEDAAATSLDVLANDTSAPDVGETLSITAVSLPAHGVATTDGAKVSYQPATDFNGTDSFSYTISDGNGGTDTATVTVTVTSVNDVPIATDDSFTVLENSGQTLVSVLSNDSTFPDVGETLTITVALSPTNGTVTITGGGTGLAYTPDPDFTGTETFTYTVSDGRGGSATATVTVTVDDVYTQPVNHLPPPQLTIEDTQLLFSTAAGNAITVADANNPTLTVQVSVTNGTFALGATAGLAVSGNNTPTVTAQGTIAALNAGLENARYLPAANYNGPATLTVSTNDSTGESALDNLSLTVTAVNDPPANTVPTATLAATEDVPKTLTSLLVSDVDVGAGTLQVTLAASNGTLLSLPSAAGLDFLPGEGDGTADASMTFRGTLTTINSALNGLTVTPPANFIGTSVLVITTNDQGNTGGGGPAQDVDTVTFAWAAVNDPPVNTVPSVMGTVEEQPLTLASAAGTGLSLSDSDASAGLLQVTLNAVGGTLTLGGTANLTFAAGDGASDPTMTFTGTLASLNAALDNTVFTPATDFAGTATVTMISNDLGNSGAGTAGQDTDTISITVSPVNDPPRNSVPIAQSTNEDVPWAFSTGNGNPITVSDIDAPTLQLSVSVTNGTLTLGGKAGLSFQSGDGTADASMTFTGTLAAVNTALNGLTFAPAANYFGPATLTLLTSDLGATGAGGAVPTQSTVAITVASVNDAPSAANDAVSVVEDAPATVLDVLANDTATPDSGETLTVTAVGSAGHGTATLTAGTITYQPAPNYNGADSFSYTISDGNGGTATAAVAVTVTSVNDAPDAADDTLVALQNSGPVAVNVLSNDRTAPDLGESLTITAVSAPANGVAAITGGGTGLTYDPTGAFSGTDTFTYTISDGNGGTDTATVTVTVTPVNTTPVNTLPSLQQTIEDTQLTFLAAAGNAISVADNNPTLTVQVSVTNGTFALSGTTGLAVTGNGTPTVTAQGALAALNTALDGARYTPAPNFNGAATLSVSTSDSDGESDLDVLNLTVTAVNDPPANTVPAGVQAGTEDVPKTFTTISVSDVDVGSSQLRVSLSADNGTSLTLPTTSGLEFDLGDGADDAAMTFRGTLTAVNSALNGLTVTPPANFIGNSTLTVITNDQGNTGGGGAAQDSDTLSFTWASVNDPPVNSVPGPQATSEESTLRFSAADGNALTVSDSDVSAALLQITVSATGGTLTLGSATGLTFTAGDGSDDATMTFAGTLARVNAALENTVFKPAANFAGAASVTLLSNDQGNSGTGGAKTDSDTVTIAVAPVNDAPITSVPGLQSTNEDTSWAFSAGNGNPISVSDVDAVALQVSLSATSGTLTLAGKTGLSFQSGDGTADGSMIFMGTVAALNTALNGLVFTPGANFSGPVTLTVLASDLGATGSGGSLTSLSTVTVNVAAVNDAPDAVNDGLTVEEDAAATDLLVLANDSAAPDVGETLSVTTVATPAHGTATTDGTRITYRPAANYYGADSFTYTVSDGNGGTDTATVSVTVASVNDAPTATADAVTVLQNAAATPVNVLSNDSALPDVGESLTILSVGTPGFGAAVITGGGTGLTYAPNAGYSGPDAFTYTISDGNGGTATATVTVTVSPVNTKPVNTLPSPQQTIEDSQLTFSALAGNAITVADANSPTLTVQVSVTNGTFTLGAITGLTVTGNGTATVTAQGTLSALNNGFNNARYLPGLNFSGPATLTINSYDSDGESDVDVLTLAVTPINDPPVNAVPTGVQAAVEDEPKTFTSISVSDVDVGAGSLQVTLAANNGTTISLPDTTGLAFSTGSGVADAAMTFTGTLTAINSALNGLTVTPPANFIGSSTLVVTTSDQGNTGGGGPSQDSDTISFTWAAVNDPPVNAVPGLQTIDEETTLAFSAAGGNALTLNDVDVSAGLLQVTLSATGGTLTVGSKTGVTFSAGDGTADGTMTFTGTLASLNAALNGTVFTANANFAGTATVTLLSSDQGNSGVGGAKTDTDTVTINVTGANDAPVNTVPVAQSINEDVARVFSATNGNAITVADVDATSLQVTLTASNGVLTLGGFAGLSFQAGDGTADASVTFTGTVPALNLALNGLTFAPTPNYYGPASLTVLTSDLGATGLGGSLVDQDAIAITVNSVNDLPDAVNDAVMVAEDAPATDLTVLANDTAAPDLGETLTITAISPAPAHGTATIQGSVIRYQPAADYNGADSFSYTVSDGNGGSDTATVAVTVESVNDAPTAADDSITVLQGSGPVAVNVLTNDSALPDLGETLILTPAFTQPANGTVALTVNGTSTGLTYDPLDTFTGTDSFTYTISDGNGGTATATVTVEVTAVNNNPVNNLPVPQQTIEDIPLVFSSAGGNAITVADANGGNLTVQIAVTSGTLTLGATAGLVVTGNNSSTVTASGAIAALNAGLNNSKYTPTANFNGSSTLRIDTSDSTGNHDIDVLTLTVTDINDPPVNTVPTANQAATEDVPKTFTTISVADADVGASQLLVTLVASNGTLVSLSKTQGLAFTLGDGTADETMSFTGTLTSINSALNGLTVIPPVNFIGTSTLVLVTNDQGNTGTGGALQDSDTIGFTWAAQNDAPVNAVPGPQAVDEEGALTFSSDAGTRLSVTDADLGAGLVQVTLSATNGTLSLGNTELATFTAGDGIADATMTFNGSLADVNAALEGTTFVPNANFPTGLNPTGAAVVTMATSDLGNSGGAAKTDTDTVAVTVHAVNDAPVNNLPLPQNTYEDGSLQFKTANGNPVTVADNDATALQVTLSVSVGTVTLGTKTGLTFLIGTGAPASTMTFVGPVTAINTALNTLVFQPSADYWGPALLTISTRDNGSTGLGGTLVTDSALAITVLPVNDPPTAAADAFTVTEDAAETPLLVLANDSFLPDSGESLTITAVSAPANGTATTDGAQVVYQPKANYAGADSFTYTISDGNGATAVGTVSVTVTAVNDLPDALDDLFTVTQNAGATQVPVLANDTILPDTGETLTITAIAAAPAHGTVLITGGGTGLTYQPDTDYFGPDQFTYTISDGTGIDTAQVAVTVTPIDYVPVAADDTLSVPEDGSGTVAVLGNDTKLGNWPITVALATPPAHGTAVVQGADAFLYTPAPDYEGTDSFTYTVTDNGGDSATATVTVTVTPVDDLPVAVADSATTAEDTSVRISVRSNDTRLVDLPVALTVSAAPTHGTTEVEADGAITYQPEADWSGADTFTYTVTDRNGDTSNAEVTITVTPVNDAPEATSDFSATRVGVAVVIDVLANDSDVEGDTLTLAVATAPAHGTASVTADSKVSYTPAAAYTGTDTFTYTVADTSGLTATATVTVGVGVDTDADGLPDVDELALGTDPNDPDTDRDLISDSLEVKVTQTEPLDDDTDDDGLLDGHEDLNKNGTMDEGETSAKLADSDSDGLQDGTELGLATPEGGDTLTTAFVPDLDPATKTDPRKADSDNGGLADGEEDANHDGRVDAGETDPNSAADDQPEGPDADGDGVADTADNCRDVANAAQGDADDDGVGDACELPLGETPISSCGCGPSGSAGTTGQTALLLLLGLTMVARRRSRPAGGLGR